MLTFIPKHMKTGPFYKIELLHTDGSDELYDDVFVVSGIMADLITVINVIKDSAHAITKFNYEDCKYLNICEENYITDLIANFTSVVYHLYKSEKNPGQWKDVTISKVTFTDENGNVFLVKGY